jgi:topoisomerase-4 subunit A
LKTAAVLVTRVQAYGAFVQECGLRPKAEDRDTKNMTQLEPLMERNFLEYASYVIVDRAIPDIRDGFKPVQRRILTTLLNMDDGKFHKVANVIGETMKLHPHGDASIGDALVVLANKEYFIEKQGNFGNIITGHSAAAARYIECRLTELAKETLFSKAVTKYQPSYDGRREEPVLLPAKLPVVLMLGTEGIAVGMATKILPYNFKELLEAEISILKHESFTLVPDFATGGIVDVSEYDDGRGKARVRARIESKDDKTIVIREIPFSTTTESLIASIESAAQKGKVKITSIDDFTTDKVEVEIGLPRGVYAEEVIPQLYAYTDCEVSVSSNIVVIKDKHPVQLAVTDVLLHLTEKLRDQICEELEWEMAELNDKKHWLTLERLFIEKKIYKRIETAKTAEDVKLEVYEGLKPHFKDLAKSVDDEDIKKLLEIPIRRISAYDIEKNRRDIEDVELEIKKIESKLKRLTQTTIKYLEHLIEKYGDRYPRKTEISGFEAVDVKAVARQTIKVGFEAETGFFGSQVKGTDYQATVSEYDRFLIICEDGTFRIIGPDAKVLIPGKVIYMNIFDQEQGAMFTVIYRDKDKIPFAKKVHIKRFIRDREYELIKDKAGKVDYLLPGYVNNMVTLKFQPGKRQRVNETEFDLGGVEEIGVSGRGSRLAPKPVTKIVVQKMSEIPIPPSTATTSESPGAPPSAPLRERAEKKKPPDGGGGEQFSLF